jgi:hypothetical protein
VSDGPDRLLRTADAPHPQAPPGRRRASNRSDEPGRARPGSARPACGAVGADAGPHGAGPACRRSQPALDSQRSQPRPPQGQADPRPRGRIARRTQESLPSCRAAGILLILQRQRDRHPRARARPVSMTTSPPACATATRHWQARRPHPTRHRLRRTTFGNADRSGEVRANP